MTLEEQFEAILHSGNPGVPTHLGFNMEVTVLLANAKHDPSDENVAAARAALRKQIDGYNPLGEALQALLDGLAD